MKTRDFDYVIVGAGTAGCTLACRLSENEGARVLIIEAGGWDSHPLLQVPVAWPYLFRNRMKDWMYFSEPDASIGPRRLDCARGKVVGGSSTINAMAYMRGHPRDYDRWAARGLPEWSYERVLPYFKRSESWEGGGDIYRGGNGPLTTRFSRFDDPLRDCFTESGMSAGYGVTADFNGAEPEGFATWQSTIRDGRRCSAAVAFLRPALKRPNVELVVKALTTRVIMEGTKALGVEFVHDGQLHIAHAQQEVILAAGVINTPQLLNLSGIGDPDDLRRLGIAPIIGLRGVGRNLQDHISVGISYARKEPGPLCRALRGDRILRELGNAYFRGKGIATDLPAGGLAHLKSAPDEILPDIQLLMAAAPMDARPYLSPFVPAYGDGFMIRAVVLRPESRGYVRLISSKPDVAPIIVQNFLATDRDRKALRSGVRMARDVGRQRPLARLVDRELTPKGYSDIEIDELIGSGAISVHHPCGTCKMGAEDDELAVVDSELRVFGAQRLRVVDASAMPDIVGGAINAPVFMIAEKAADLISGARNSHANAAAAH